MSGKAATLQGWKPGSVGEELDDGGEVGAHGKVELDDGWRNGSERRLGIAVEVAGECDDLEAGESGPSRSQSRALRLLCGA